VPSSGSLEVEMGTKTETDVRLSPSSPWQSSYLLRIKAQGMSRAASGGEDEQISNGGEEEGLREVGGPMDGEAITLEAR
jgi:hypothetical protein